MFTKANSTFVALLCTIATYAQIPAAKELSAKRTTQSVKIDGLINDEALKDAAYDFNDHMEYKYFKNRDHTLDVSDNNNISFKIIYFLDYLQLKKKPARMTRSDGKK
jgi:hypothetical protein